MRYLRKAVAEDTIDILAKGYFNTGDGNTVYIKNEINFSVNNTIYYPADKINGLIAKREKNKELAGCIIEVKNESTIACLSRLIKQGQRDIGLLNFASAKNPGGGFLSGSLAQEESLAGSSSLYPCIKSAKTYYDENRKGPSAFYNDNMIFSPNVVFFKNDTGSMLNPVLFSSVITAPAVNRSALRAINAETLQKIEEVMKHRIRGVLAIAEYHKIKCLILGAWGCGVFRNDPKEISKYFREVIYNEYRFSFNKIVFAIFTREDKMIKPFEMDFLNGSSLTPLQS